MSEHQTTEKVYTKAELDSVVRSVTLELRRDVERLEKELRNMAVRACVAEWAIAGVLSRNLHLSVHADMGQTQDAIELARHVGMSAGAQFLHRADLAFKEHAKHSELMSKIPPYQQYSHHSAEFDLSPSNWPRAFK